MSEILRSTFPDIPNPPRAKVTYGLPFHQACCKHVKNTFSAKRVYIIVSKTLSERTNYLKTLEEALKSTCVVRVWRGVPSHTPADSLLPIIADIKEFEADCLVTLGGGSITDAAKLIAMALANDVKTLEKLYSLPRIGTTYDISTGSGNGPTIPLICIPTSLSGGEYSNYAGVTHPVTRFKDQFKHDELFPSLVILDPAITISTPMWVWLSTGVRSIDHCVEGYLSINATPQGDKAAEKGLILLVEGLLKLVSFDQSADVDARLQCQLGTNASLTMLQLQILDGASHGVGHQLGAMGVAHGHTSCIMLPAVCKFNVEINGEKQEKLKNLLLTLPCVKELMPEVQQQESVDLGDVLRAIFDALGMPRNLKDVKFGEEKWLQLATKCLDEVFIHSNPRPIKTVEDVIHLLNLVKG